MTDGTIANPACVGGISEMLLKLLVVFAPTLDRLSATAR